MTDIHGLARQYASAHGSLDESEMQQVLAQVDEARLHEFFGIVDDLVEAGEHALDTELLHSALREAGFDATDALRLAPLGGGNLAAWLASRDLHAGGDDELPGPLDAAHALVRRLDELQEQDAPLVERYVRRLLDGRHDLRRVSDRALAALAEVFAVPLDLLRALRDAADVVGGPSPAAAAARGGQTAAATVLEGDGHAPDAVDELFCGRVSPG